MIDQLDVRWAARAMRAAVQASFEHADIAPVMRARSDAIFDLLDAPELAGFIAKNRNGFDHDWEEFSRPRDQIAVSGDPREGVWFLLGLCLRVDRGQNVFGGFLSAPRFVEGALQRFGELIVTAPELWDETHHSVIEACLVAINPMLQFRTASAALLPEVARFQPGPGPDEVELLDWLERRGKA